MVALLALAIAVRRRRRSQGPAQPAALGAYLDLTDALAPRGHPMIEHATPREYLRGVSADPAIERAVVTQAEVVVATLERDRFSGRPAADADLDRARAGRRDRAGARGTTLTPDGGTVPAMCRSIKTLRRPDEAATEEEIRAAALQFVRKVSGYREPSRKNEEAFNAAVDEVASASRRLLDRVSVR